MKPSPAKLRAVPNAAPSGLHVGRQAAQPFKEVFLPIDTITATLGVVGQRGSGKTHFLTVTLEEMLERRLPVAIIDPMGVFYGIRSSTDGAKPRFPVLLLGGEFADVPITPGMGASVAAWLLEERRPTILDVSDWHSDIQCAFVAEFSEALFVLAKKAGGRPLHVIVDEADIFCAQVPSGPAEKRSRDAIDKIVRRGRRRGLGMSLITQRPQEISKSVLSQVDLFAFLRLVSPQDRDAVLRWIESGGEWEKSLVKQSLGSLPVGTAWLWSPAWLRDSQGRATPLQKVAVRPRTTFDSGRTPMVGEEPHGPLVMAELKVGAIEFEDQTAVMGLDAKALRDRVTLLEGILQEHGIEAKATKKRRSRKK